MLRTPHHLCRYQPSPCFHRRHACTPYLHCPLGWVAGNLSHSLKPPRAFYSHLLQFEYIFFREQLAAKSSHLVLWVPIGESHWFVSLQFMMRHLRTVHHSSKWAYRDGSFPHISLPESLVVLFQGGCLVFFWLVGFGFGFFFCNPQNLPGKFPSAFFALVKWWHSFTIFLYLSKSKCTFQNQQNDGANGQKEWRDKQQLAELITWKHKACVKGLVSFPTLFFGRKCCILAVKS